MLSDAVNIDELEDRISNLKLALSKEAPATVKRGLIDTPMFKEPIVSVPSPVEWRHTGMDNVVTVESTEPSHSPDIHEIILLSDSEDNSPAADVSSEEVLSSVMENDAPTASNMLKEVKPPEQRMLTNDGHMPLKPQICNPASNISASSRPVSTDSRGNIATSQGLDGMKKTRLPNNANNNSLLPKSVKSSVSGTSQPQRQIQKNLSQSSGIYLMMKMILWIMHLIIAEGHKSLHQSLVYWFLRDKLFSFQCLLEEDKVLVVRLQVLDDFSRLNWVAGLKIYWKWTTSLLLGCLLLRL